MSGRSNSRGFCSHFTFIFTSSQKKNRTDGKFVAGECEKSGRNLGGEYLTLIIFLDSQCEAYVEWCLIAVNKNK